MANSVVIGIPVLLIGGTELQTLDLVSVLLSGGYKVKVCVYYEYADEMVKRFEASGAKVHLLKYARADGLWHLAKGLFKLFRTLRPDIVHVQYIAPGLVPILAASAARVSTIFSTAHQPGQPYGWPAHFLIRIASFISTAFLCVSQSVESSWFGDSALLTPEAIDSRRKHFTLYNGVDVRGIKEHSDQADRQGIRAALNVTGEKIIGFVGRLRHEKGLHVLLRAMPKILRSHPDALLLIIGDGPDGETLRAQAEYLRLGNHVKWVGQKSAEEIYQLYSIMDVVVVPSLFEGFGLVAAEAQAAGLPVVASEIGGLKEIVENNETGYLVPVGDVTALSSALTRLLTDELKAREQGMRGHQRMQSLFSRERFVQTIIAAYHFFSIKARTPFLPHR